MNNDGEVNISDVSALIDVLLGGNADEDTLKRADVNSDNDVNISDVSSLIDYILRGFMIF